MFRTRDFILFLTAALFLIMAIGLTIFGGNDRGSAVDSQYVTAPITDVSAVNGTESQNTLSRAERLAALRDKIAQSDLVIESQIPQVDENVIIDQGQSVATSTLGQLQLCPDYRQLTRISWPVADIKVVEAEGVRQYYTEELVSVGVGTTSSSTLIQNVLLTLPSQFLPTGNSNCLPTDVVGVALDGSLIRNTEAKLYGVFGSETLIGYALDGFPIYGVGQNLTGECGGRIQLGQYRYELSANREVILNCFAGVPQSFTP